MARFGSVVFIFFFSFAAFMSDTEGRKLLMSTRAPESNDRDRSSVGSLASLALISALPKGRVTSSCPGKKGHATLDNEQILARHLASIDRILRSVPSPGVGN